MKILEGTRADRIGPIAPAAVQALPPCPSHLEGPARAKWATLVALLERSGRLAETDADLLAIYCVVHARWRDALREIGVDLVVSTGLGGVKANPAVAIAAQAERQLAQLQEQLGLTPEGRARLDKLRPPSDGDELDEFLGKGKKGTG